MKKPTQSFYIYDVPFDRMVIAKSKNFAASAKSVTFFTNHL